MSVPSLAQSEAHLPEDEETANWQSSSGTTVTFYRLGLHILYHEASRSFQPLCSRFIANLPFFGVVHLIARGNSVLLQVQHSEHHIRRQQVSTMQPSLDGVLVTSLRSGLKDFKPARSCFLDKGLGVTQVFCAHITYPVRASPS